MGKKFRNFFISFSSVILLLLVWKIASVTGIFGRVEPKISRLLLPPPEVVLSKFIEMLFNGYLLENIWTSMQRVLIGFFWAVLIGIPTGVFMGLKEDIRHFLYPIIRIIAPIPGAAWIPLAILWFGLGNKAAIFIITVSSVSPIVMNVIQGMESIDKSLSDAMSILHAKKWQRILYLVLPSIMPYMVTGFRLGLGYAWRVVIAAELVGVPGGLGYVLNTGRSTAQTEVTIIVIITLSMMLIFMEQLCFKPVEKITNQWKADREDRGY